MNLPDDAVLYRAIICALLVRAGGRITLSAEEIVGCKGYQVCPQSDRANGTVILTLRKSEPARVRYARDENPAGVP